MDKAIENLNYFVGKPCSVHARGINWRLTDENIVDYYVGIVELINEYGICLKNVINNKKTFIFMQGLVSISEETVVDKDDPETEKMLQSYEEKKQAAFKHNDNIIKPTRMETPASKPIQQVDNSPFVDIKSMTQLAKQAKERLGK